MIAPENSKHAALRDFLRQTMPAVLDDLTTRCPDDDKPGNEATTPGAKIDSRYQNPFESLCACLACAELLTPDNPHTVLVSSDERAAHLERALTPDKLDAWLHTRRPKWSCLEVWLWHFQTLSIDFWGWPVPRGPDPFSPCKGLRPLLPALVELGYLETAQDLAAWTPKLAPLTRQTTNADEWGELAETFHD